MKIEILCSSSSHPVWPWLRRWANAHQGKHDIRLVTSKADLSGGVFLFLVACTEIVSEEERKRFEHSLILHASDLPKGRGWSPYIWELAAGAETLCLSLLEAENKVDSGAVWAKRFIHVPAHALWDEINDILFSEKLKLLTYAVENVGLVAPKAQSDDIEPTYYRRRTPDDSRIDVNKSIAEQFDLMRVCDPTRFPAFFDHRGHRYKLTIEKLNDS